MSAVLNFRIGIPELRLISGPRPSIQLGQQPVTQRLRLQLGHTALRVIDVAKNDRPRRTGLLAGRLDLAVAHYAILFFRRDFRLIDALDTVGTDRKSTRLNSSHEWISR